MRFAQAEDLGCAAACMCLCVLVGGGLSWAWMTQDFTAGLFAQVLHAPVQHEAAHGPLRGRRLRAARHDLLRLPDAVRQHRRLQAAHGAHARRGRGETQITRICLFARCDHMVYPQ